MVRLDIPGLQSSSERAHTTVIPPIEPLLPPDGAPNVLVVLLDDVGFAASLAFYAVYGFVACVALVLACRTLVAEGLARLRPYEPAHHGVFVNELIGQATRLLGELNEGHLPYLIPPVIRFTDAEDPDFSR